MEYHNLQELMTKLTYKDHAIIKGLGITGIQYDSRKVELGNLFVAIKGFKSDGHKYIQDALANGAIAVIVEDEEYCGLDYPWILVEDSRQALAEISAAFYANPSEKLKLIGVTGTNGKTTTTNLIAQILESKGKKVGVIGTLGARIGNEFIEGSRTTPEALELQQLFAQMLSQGAEYAVMEVSSHALDLHRVDKCHFDVAVFTNLTQDHLDYHHNMEEYCKAKTKLFMMMDKSKPKGVPKTAVINIDDEWANRFLVSSGGAVATYGIDKEASWKAENVEIRPDGVRYTVDGLEVDLPLCGKFNIYNSLAAMAAANALGVSLEDCIKALNSSHGVSGRFQRVRSDKDFTVIIDYAHTPDGLENVITTAKEITDGRVITVFGCGGDRDRTKRPIMGEISAKLSDYCVVTSDNPRTEDPEKIIEDILPGVKKYMAPNRYKVIVDRHEAIREAVKAARSGDIVLIAGKGHEDYQEINGIKHHFNDYEEAENALNEVK